MKRTTVMLTAVLFVAGISTASFAQYESPAPPSPTIAQPVPTSAAKAERQNKRMACRDQAKQQGIKGDPMRDFMKSCMRG